MEIKGLNTIGLAQRPAEETPAIPKPGDTPAKAKEAAQQFESMLVKQMLGSMWKTVGKNHLLGSKDEETYRDFYNEALANDIAAGQGLGLKEVFVKDFERNQAVANATAGKANPYGKAVKA